MRILVTGGAGFIGSALVGRLIGEGHDVSILDITSPHPLYHGNITDKWDVDKSLDGIEVVYHLAGASNIDKVKDNPLQTISSNIMGTANLLHFSVLHNIKRFIFVSTVYVYNSHGHLYTTTKRCGESLTKDFHTLYNLPYTILRLGTVYGEKSRDEDVVSIFVKRALEGKPLEVHGDGNQSRRFLYIGDAVEALVRAMKPKAEDKTLTIVGPRTVTINELAKVVQNEVPHIVINHFPNKQREDGVAEDNIVSNVDIEKETIEVLNWAPCTEVEEGIPKIVEWYST